MAQHHSRQGCDATHNCPYTITVAPLGGPFIAGDLNVEVKYEYLSTDQVLVPRSNPDISRWDLQITGVFNSGFKQDLGEKLNDEEVPLDIQNDVVSLVAEHVETSCIGGVHAWIEIYLFDYEDKEVIKEDEMEMKCVVCMEEFEVGLKATKLPCSHLFHGDCIGRWLENRSACPLCRHEL